MDYTDRRDRMTNATDTRRHPGMTLSGPFVPDERRKIGRRFTDALVLAAELHAGQRRKGKGPAVRGPPAGRHGAGVRLRRHRRRSHRGVASRRDRGRTARPWSRWRTAADRRALRRDSPRHRGRLHRQRRSAEEAVARAEARLCRARRGRSDASTLLVSACDKLHNVRAIVRDYRLLGDDLWSRFSPEAGMQGTVGYYRGS